MEGRELIFRVDDNFYLMHVGQSIQETMKKALSREELKKLGLIKSLDTVQVPKD